MTESSYAYMVCISDPRSVWGAAFRSGWRPAALAAAFAGRRTKWDLIFKGGIHNDRLFAWQESIRTFLFSTGRLAVKGAPVLAGALAFLAAGLLLLPLSQLSPALAAGNLRVLLAAGHAGRQRQLDGRLGKRLSGRLQRRHR